MSDTVFNKDNLVRGLIVVVVLFMAREAYGMGAQQRAAEVTRITAQRDSLVAANEMLERHVEFRDSLRRAAEEQKEAAELEADTLRVTVAKLDSVRVETRVQLLALDDADDVQNAFREAFPLLHEEMRILQAPARPNSLFGDIDWLSVPLDDARAFITYKNDAESFEEQRDLLQRVDSLQRRATQLADSITVLVAANAQEYKTGYEAAFANYTELVPLYTEQLERRTLQLPNRWGVIGGGLLGGVAGLAICSVASR